MEYLKRKRDLAIAQPLSVEETLRILEAIPGERLEDLRDFALLLTSLATGMRMREVLDLRVRNLAELPGALLDLAGMYIEVVIELGMTRPSDYLFPNLVWLTCRRSVPAMIPLTPRIFVVTLKQRAAMAGIDPARVNPGAWRRMAGYIHHQVGGFRVFAEGLHHRASDFQLR